MDQSCRIRYKSEMAQFHRSPTDSWLEKVSAVAANKQALIKLLGESIVQHYRLSSLEMSSGEVPYLSGAFNHCPRKSAEMESPIVKSYTVHTKRRTLVWFYMLSMQTKRSVKVESKVGSLLNRLIQMGGCFHSCTFDL